MKDIKSKLCLSCGKCCQFMVLPLVRPLQKAMENIMVDWLDARGCEVIRETADTLYVKVDYPCPHVIGKGCGIYKSRPEGCKVFDGRKFDFLDCAWKESYVVLEKAIPGTIGARKFVGKRERKRASKRASRERKREKREQVRTYGSELEEE